LQCSHNSPLLLDHNGGVTALEANGIPLGIYRDAAYEEKSCRLGPGDQLILFSDGVTETHAVDGEEEFGEQRLVSFVQRKRHLSADGIIQRIRAETASFSQGSPADDDITLVLAFRR
jgi:sigma-B regulation protein RsbU (phosphoserine phosphatase)